MLLCCRKALNFGSKVARRSLVLRVLNTSMELVSVGWGDDKQLASINVMGWQEATANARPQGGQMVTRLPCFTTGLVDGLSTAAPRTPPPRWAPLSSCPGLPSLARRLEVTLVRLHLRLCVLCSTRKVLSGVPNPPTLKFLSGSPKNTFKSHQHSSI